MKRQLAILLASCALAGCVSDRSHPKNGAELINYGPSEKELIFWKRSWEGFWGPHGYVGFRRTSYDVALIGPGPMFTNPRFVDNPPSFRCLGSIALDMRKSTVSVSMRRIIEKPGKSVRTVPHPANGTYPITLIREAGPNESADFHNWIAKTNKF